MSKRVFVLRKSSQSSELNNGKQTRCNTKPKSTSRKQSPKAYNCTEETQNTLEGYDYRKLRGLRLFTKCRCGAIAMPQSDYCFYCNPK